MITIQFDFDTFTPIVADVYSMLKISYNLEDVLSVFRCFFQAYETKIGECHPGLKREQIAAIISAMPQIWIHDIGSEAVLIDLYPDEYRMLINQYFETYFPKCNYRINHFFSGRVREMRLYEIS